MSVRLSPNKGVTITVAASDKLAVYSPAAYKVTQVTAGSPNIPSAKSVLQNAAGAYLSAAFTNATSVTIQAGDSPLHYATGTAPSIPEQANLESILGTPGTLNATGTLTGALILGAVVTSTTAAAVTATLDTGTVMDAVVDSAALNDSFQWSAINTGGSNAFTVTAASGHTLVGSGAVAASSSGRFLTRRSAALTWITYRLS